MQVNKVGIYSVAVAAMLTNAMCMHLKTSIGTSSGLSLNGNFNHQYKIH